MDIKVDVTVGGGGYSRSKTPYLNTWTNPLMIVLVRPPLAHHHGNTPNNSMEMGTCTQCSVTTAILHLTLDTDQSYSLHWETSGHIDSPVMLSVDPALNANQVVQRMRTPSAALSTFSPPPPGGYIQSRKPRNVQQRRKKPLR